MNDGVNGEEIFMNFSMRWILVLALLFSLNACSMFTPKAAIEGTPGYSQTGKASFYADSLQGNKTANGEIFSQKHLTAAHRHLPFGSKVKVVNRANGKSVVVRVNDRGPFVRGRIIDLSKAAFRRIANTSEGVVNIRITVLR